MEGRFMLLLVAMVVMVHSCCGSVGYTWYPNPPQAVVQQPTQAPLITFCSFNRTPVLIDQQFQMQGNNVYRTCRAEAIINTCASNSCTQTTQCNCCKPSAESRWVTQVVKYDCSDGNFQTVEWHTLEPKYCHCNTC